MTADLREQAVQEQARRIAALGLCWPDAESRQRRCGRKARRVVGPGGKVYRSAREAATCCRCSETHIHTLIDRRGSGWRWK